MEPVHAFRRRHAPVCWVAGLLLTLGACGSDQSPGAGGGDGGTGDDGQGNPVGDGGPQSDSASSSGGGSDSGSDSGGPITQNIIPMDRVTTWNPGMNAVGGIPNATNVIATVAPLGNGQDDTNNIQGYLNKCGNANGGPVGDPSKIQVIQLTAGTFNINGNGLSLVSSGCVLRGVGPGTGDGQGNATVFTKQDWMSNPSYGILYIGNSNPQDSTDLAQDAVKGTTSLVLKSNPGLNVHDIVLVDMVTDNDPDVVWGPSHDPPGGGSRRWFIRQDRSLSQLMEVTAVNGTTVTFATPFHITFQTKYQAQLTRYDRPFLWNVGVEDIYFEHGQGGDGHGNIPMSTCAYCWIKHVEANHSIGTSVGLYSTYRTVLRDSYIHTSDDPNPGGGGYLIGLNTGASDNLVENDISWSGNKEIVMRGTGGGNVVAYNYMDDSYGSTYPESSEAGLNAGHYTTPHFELLEGNYSQNYKGDSYWGNSIYITVFRNHLSALRAAHPPLDKYSWTDPQNGCVYPFMDIDGRGAVDVQAYSYDTNFVGNVLGLPGEKLLSYDSHSCFDDVQTRFVYENLDDSVQDNAVIMWTMGSYQASVNTQCGCWTWLKDTYTTQLRQGNWDFTTGQQTWYAGSGVGASGSASTGKAQPMPSSLYLTSKPAFFGSNPWPWTDPSNGTIAVLPAKQRFDAGTPNQL